MIFLSEVIHLIFVRFFLLTFFNRIFFDVPAFKVNVLLLSSIFFEAARVVSCTAVIRPAGAAIVPTVRTAASPAACNRLAFPEKNFIMFLLFDLSFILYSLAEISAVCVLPSGFSYLLPIYHLQQLHFLPVPLKHSRSPAPQQVPSFHPPCQRWKAHSCLPRKAMPCED